MPRVKIPAPYQGPTQGEGRVEVTATTVRGCIAAVEVRYPGFGPQVFDGAGGLHKFVKLFLNGDELARTAEALETVVADADEVEILAAIGGG